MTEDKLNIDEFYKNKLQDHRIESTPEGLTAYSKMINKFNFFRFGFGTFNIYYSVLAALIITTGSILYVNSLHDEKSNKQNDQQEVIDKMNVENPIDGSIEKSKNDINGNILNKNTEQVTDGSNKSLENKLEANDEITEPINEKSLETPADENPVDTAIVVVHDTVIVKKKIIITDTVTTVIHKDKKDTRKKKK